MKPKVTVYIPCYNYGHYLAEAVQSVIEQTYKSWELIIINDGSTDDTLTIAKYYASEHPEKIRIISHHSARGLQASANCALEAAKGDYIMRLDADDYLDENALLVMVNYLDQHPDVGLVYPNYIYVDEKGDFLGIEIRKKIGKEALLLDLPAHGACTMVRKRVLKSIGGYSEYYDAQDGHELWLKVLHRYKVANLSTPLFFYRQHEKSVSKDERRILSARQRIKRDLVKRSEGQVKPRIVAVIPAKNTYEKLPNIVLKKFLGQSLIDYTLKATLETEVFDKILVTTDDRRVFEYCQKFSGVLPLMRSSGLSFSRAKLSEVLYDAIMRLEQEFNIFPDIIVLLSVHSPLRRSEHILKAIDTLLLYNTNTVISVYEDYELHFTHGGNGIEPINKGMLQRLRLEREALYVDNGAIKVFWRDVIGNQDLYGKKIGHSVMTLEDSFQIKTPFDIWLIEELLRKNHTKSNPSPFCQLIHQ